MIIEYLDSVVGGFVGVTGSPLLVVLLLTAILFVIVLKK